MDGDSAAVRSCDLDEMAIPQDLLDAPVDKIEVSEPRLRQLFELDLGAPNDDPMFVNDVVASWRAGPMKPDEVMIVEHVSGMDGLGGDDFPIAA